MPKVFPLGVILYSNSALVNSGLGTAWQVQLGPLIRFRRLVWYHVAVLVHLTIQKGFWAVSNVLAHLTPISLSYMFLRQNSDGDLTTIGPI